MDNKLYWKTREGKILDVDLMTDSHVRNAFKMLLRNNKALRAPEEDVHTVYANYLKATTPNNVFGYNSAFNTVEAEPALEIDNDWWEPVAPIGY